MYCFLIQNNASAIVLHSVITLTLVPEVGEYPLNETWFRASMPMFRHHELHYLWEMLQPDEPLWHDWPVINMISNKTLCQQDGLQPALYDQIFEFMDF